MKRERERERERETEGGREGGRKGEDAFRLARWNLQRNYPRLELNALNHRTKIQPRLAGWCMSESESQDLRHNYLKRHSVHSVCVL